MWVLVPTDEILFFVRTKKSIQKKTARCRLLPALRRFYRGLLEGTPVPPAKCGIPAAPLRAIPDKTASARRGIRGMSCFLVEM
ncbi:MAG: hypothetical protein ABL933_04000 [Methyloglobulus sp.]|nr:hypothetical protein [Methyloglobulus sp.]